MLDLQQTKITNLAETINALKTRLTEFEFKLEASSFGGKEELRSDIRKYQKEMADNLEQRLSALEEGHTRIAKRIKETLKTELKAEILDKIDERIGIEIEEKIKQKKFKASFASEFKKEDVIEIIDSRVTAANKATSNTLSTLKAKVEMQEELSEVRVSSAKTKLENKVHETISTLKQETEEARTKMTEVGDQARNILKEFKMAKQTFEEVKEQAVATLNQELSSWKLAEEEKNKTQREELTKYIKGDFERLTNDLSYSTINSFTKSPEFIKQTELINSMVSSLNYLKQEMTSLKSQNHRNPRPRESDEQQRTHRPEQCKKCQDRGFRELWKSCWRHNRNIPQRRETQRFPRPQPQRDYRPRQQQYNKERSPETNYRNAQRQDYSNQHIFPHQFTYYPNMGMPIPLLRFLFLEDGLP